LRESQRASRRHSVIEPKIHPFDPMMTNQPSPAGSGKIKMDAIWRSGNRMTLIGAPPLWAVPL
jgi:hypothetical protein